MRILWLADVLRSAGLTVVEHPDWQTRGFQPWEPRYGIVHATAAPRTQSDKAQVAIVRDGHSTLSGPIANACLARDGVWHVLASGRCNTALTGWAGPASGLGNTNLLGVEACNDNGLVKPPEPWSTVQYDSYVRGWAAICRQMGWGADRVVGHKEHQPSDKTDPLFDMVAFRRGVIKILVGAVLPAPPQVGGDDMIGLVRLKDDPKVYLYENGMRRRWITSEQELADVRYLASSGQIPPLANGGQVAVVDRIEAYGEVVGGVTLELSDEELQRIADAAERGAEAGAPTPEEIADAVVDEHRDRLGE